MMHLGMDYNAVQAVSEYQFFGLVYSWLMGEYLLADEIGNEPVYLNFVDVVFPLFAY